MIVHTSSQRPPRTWSGPYRTRRRLDSQRRSWLLAVAVTLAVCALSSQSVAQVDDACRQKVMGVAEAQGIPLRVVLERLEEAQRAAPMRWADCQAPHAGLALIYEQAVRSLDASSVDKAVRTLYLSPSQTLKVTDPEGVFPRSEVVGLVNTVAEARAHAAAQLGPSAGAEGWTAVLAELNAETHALEVHIALQKAGLLEFSPNVEASQLGTALLVASAYVQQAQGKHPVVFNRMASSAESVDAFGILWRRSVKVLLDARTLKTHDIVDPLLKSLAPQTSALEALFRQAGIKPPDFGITLEPIKKDADPQSGDGQQPSAARFFDENDPGTAPTGGEEPGGEQQGDVKALAEPAGDGGDEQRAGQGSQPGDKAVGLAGKAQGEDKPAEKSAEDGAGDRPADKLAAQDAAKAQGGDGGGAGKKVDSQNEDKGKGESDKGAEKDDEGEGAAGAEKSEGDAEEGLSMANKLRLGVGGFLLLFPWILVGFLSTTRSRRPELYARVANRSVALSTLLVVFEVLAMSLLFVLGAFESLWTVDSAFLFFPPYLLGVVIVMLGRMDEGEELASRKLFKRWGKWVAIAFGVILLANAILVPTVFILTPQFIIFPSALIVAVIACVFLVKLWRTGDAPSDEQSTSAAPSGGDDGGKEQRSGSSPDEPPAPKAVEPSVSQPSPDEASAAPSLEQAAPAAPAPAPEEDNPAAQLSDDDLLKALEGLKSADSGSSSQESELSDKDRDELYKLLDG